MVTCYLEYKIDMYKVDEVRTLAEMWIPLVEKYGGVHHGYFVPSQDEKAKDHGRFSFPGMGSEGPTDVAVAVFSFPDWEAYERYRSEAGEHEECRTATKLVEETGCFTRYERTFMTPVVGD